MRLQDEREHPHGLSDARVRRRCSPTDKPVDLRVPRLPVAHPPAHLPPPRATRNIHVRGYKEEGTTTTPFDMVMLNDLDRFHLVIDVIDHVPSPRHARRPACGRRWSTRACGPASTPASTATTCPRSATGSGPTRRTQSDDGPGGGDAVDRRRQRVAPHRPWGGRRCPPHGPAPHRHRIGDAHRGPQHLRHVPRGGHRQVHGRARPGRPAGPHRSSGSGCSARSPGRRTSATTCSSCCSSHDGVDLTYDECVGVTYEQVHDDPEAALAQIVARYHDVERRATPSSSSAPTTPTSPDPPSSPTTPASPRTSARPWCSSSTAATARPPSIAPGGRRRRHRDARQPRPGGRRRRQPVRPGLGQRRPRRPAGRHRAAVVGGARRTRCSPRRPSGSCRRPCAGRSSRATRRCSSREVLDVIVGAMSVEHLLGRLTDGAVVITPGDRSDVLLGLLMAHQAEGFPSLAGIILNGGFRPAPLIARLVERPRAAGCRSCQHRAGHLPVRERRRRHARAPHRRLAAQGRHRAVAVRAARRRRRAAGRARRASGPRSSPR